MILICFCTIQYNFSCGNDGVAIDKGAASKGSDKASNGKHWEEAKNDNSKESLLSCYSSFQKEEKY